MAFEAFVTWRGSSPSLTVSAFSAISAISAVSLKSSFRSFTSAWCCLYKGILVRLILHKTLKLEVGLLTCKFDTDSLSSETHSVHLFDCPLSITSVLELDERIATLERKVSDLAEPLEFILDVIR